MPMSMTPRFLIDIEQDGKGQRLLCRTEFDYGAATLGPGEENPHIQRDAPGEEDARMAARLLFPTEREDGTLAFEGKEEEIFSLLAERLHTLEQDGIFVSTGSACSSNKKGQSHLLAAMGRTPKEIEAALRFSFSRYNTAEEMDRVLDKLTKAVSSFRRLGSFR